MSHVALRKAKLTVRARGNFAHGNNHMLHFKYTLNEQLTNQSRTYSQRHG
jgi:hypothetical protein